MTPLAMSSPASRVSSQPSTSVPIDKVQAIVTHLGNYDFSSTRICRISRSSHHSCMESVSFDLFAMSCPHQHRVPRLLEEHNHTTNLVRSLAFGRSPWHEWIARANKGHVFLGKRLLDLLSRVNTVTTVLLSFSGIEENHPMRADRPCRFFRMDQGDIRKYKWEHRDVWNYEHEGSKYIMNATYSVSCESQLQPKEPIALTHHQA